LGQAAEGVRGRGPVAAATVAQGEKLTSKILNKEVGGSTKC